MEKKIVFGQVGRLKPEMIEEYDRLHANPWPEVLDVIRLCNWKNYSIFREGDLVFAYFEYVGDNFDADLEKMCSYEVNHRWWLHTHPCFVEYPFRSDSKFYADMKQIFYCE